MADTSRLVKMVIRNLGCVGPEGCEIALDNILCLVGGNNTGKSTILHAYELALETAKFNEETDLCRRANGAPASVEIWVHIPKGMANIAEEWKVPEDGLLIVRSRWEWSADTDWSVMRSTWDPEIADYSTDTKASGLDTVFSSRLPVPFRVGSLESPEAEHKKLLTLILQPVADRLQEIMADQDSELRKTISLVSDLAHAPVEEERARLEELTAELNRSHNAIFPGLKIELDLGIGDVEINPLQMLQKNSKLKFQDGLDEVSWYQQGTGSQRALFWTMLQVRSRLKSLADARAHHGKTLTELGKKIGKLKKGIETVKTEATKQAKRDEIKKIEQEIDELSKVSPETALEDQGKELSLPGYMLLIDEPETALHPNAIRAASKHLYGLAEDNAWQVMLATHSPLFIDPLQDHTTIVRLARTDANPSPRTFRSDSVSFTSEEKDNLKILNRFDQGLAEMFFGQLPVLVEGDTEFAAFELLIEEDLAAFPLATKPVLVRARGKHTMLLIMKILEQFEVPFSVLHDADKPFRSDGHANGAWTANKQLHDAIENIRSKGTRVVHRISIPTFEYAHLPYNPSEDGLLLDFPGKDKPWGLVDAIRTNPEVRQSAQRVLTELLDSDVEQRPEVGPFAAYLEGIVTDWATANCPKDRRFFPDESGAGKHVEGE